VSHVNIVPYGYFGNVLDTGPILVDFGSLYRRVPFIKD